MDNKIQGALSTSRGRNSTGNRSNAIGGPRRSSAARGAQSRDSRRQKPYQAKSRSSGTNSIALKFLLTNNESGTFIGVGGNAIKDLMKVTGTDIHISALGDYFPNSSLRVVYITGTVDGISSAQALIWEMIAAITKTSEMDESALCDWNPREAAESSSSVYEDESVEGFITLPLEAVGGVIGKGGATIQSIMEDSGAKVAIRSKEEGELTHERVVTVSGTCSQCSAAVSAILTILADEPETSQYVTKGTKYPSHAKTASDNKTRRPSNHESRPTRDRSSNSAQRRSEESSSAASATGLLSATTTITIAVPNHLVGNILGKQGATLKEIITLSGADVVLSSKGEFLEGTTNRIVQITGSPASAQTAHTLISKKIQ